MTAVARSVRSRWTEAWSSWLDIGYADGLPLATEPAVHVQGDDWTAEQPLLALQDVTLEYVTGRRVLRATQRVSLNIH